MYNVGKNIQLLRRQKGLTQEKLAEMIDVSPHHLSAIERGDSLPRLETLIRIMKVLACSPNQIFAGDVPGAVHVDKSLLAERLSTLPAKEQQRILAVLDLLINTAP